MRIIESVEPSGAYGGNFTGTVNLSMLSAAAEACRPDIALVNFSDGALTCWHSHPGGQFLWVVSGVGIVGTEADGGHVIGPGTLVQAEVDEMHWHGAAPGHDAELLAITWGTTHWTGKAPPRCAEC